MIKVLVFGVSPSRQSPDDSAFHPSTKSRQTLNKWFDLADIGRDCKDIDMRFWNLTDTKGDNAPKYNRVEHRISMLECKYDHNITLIIAVGRIVGEYLKKYKKENPNCGINWIEINHPSGLNRKLNNAEEVNKTVDSIRKFIRGSK